MQAFTQALEANPPLMAAISLLLLVVAAAIANFVVKVALLRVLHRVFAMTAWGRDPELARHGVVERLANLMPALVIYAGIGLVPGLPESAVTVVRNVTSAFMILTLARAAGTALGVVDTLYHRRPEARLKPIKGYLQVLKIGVYVIASLLMIATLIDRSPLILLSGLGAMAAVLILVFQDTLLSLVAGIQISSTDMVRVGDWIEMAGQNANGTVTEIALHTVKVENFDKTVTTVPIRKLVTEPFKNWRAMQESGGRRIIRSIRLDQTSIAFITPQEVARLRGFSHLDHYIESKSDEMASWNARLGDAASFAGNTRRPTNLGTFRAYVDAYLKAHPRIHKGMTTMVRQLEPTAEGLPLEIYCFTDTVVWVEYETIQADIFDHLFAILPEFGLRVFQSPAGSDFQRAFQPMEQRSIEEAA